MNSVASSKNVDNLFQLEDKVDANDDVATLLRTTKRFIGSNKALPSDRLEIQKISEFDLREDNGEEFNYKKVYIFLKNYYNIESNSIYPFPPFGESVFDLE